jgi:hypothetical protein
VIVAVIGKEVVFVEVNEVIFPEPLAERPIAVFEFVQVKVVPSRLLVKLAAAILVPAQTVTEEGTVTVGIGFTVIV